MRKPSDKLLIETLIIFYYFEIFYTKTYYTYTKDTFVMNPNAQTHWHCRLTYLAVTEKHSGKD